MLQNLAQRVLLLWGWRRLGLAVLAGALAALSMPPINAMPLLLIAMPLAIWLLDGSTAAPGRFAWKTLRSAFVVGWGFGFGYFVSCFWWLGAAFLVESDEFIWALPLGVIGFPACLALLHGLGFMLARMAWSSGGRRIFAFVCAMAGVEWLRSFLFTGFPWNSLGQALAGSDATAQVASLVGLNGLTLLTLFLFTAPATLGTGETPFKRVLLPAVALALFACIAAFGFWRLQTTQITLVPDVTIRIMQPNIGQREKNRLSGQQVLTRYLELSDRATTPGTSGIADVTHLFWPESPFPFILAREPQALSQIATFLKPRTVLVTGAARAEDASLEKNQIRYFNSIHVIGSDGVITDSYDKVHLVPFGEYLPFRTIFNAIGLRQFVEIPGGFEPGARRKPLSIKGLPPALPLICYEAIFPDEIQWVGARPGLLVNVTNDGWFGQTVGPHQHFAQARLRSIELGLPQIRAANTGISAVIDPLGRVVRSLSLGTTGVLDAPLPRPAAETFYASFRNIPAILLLFFFFALCIRAKSL